MGIYKNFLLHIKANYSEQALTMITRALRTASRLTVGELRYDNSPFVTHAVGVARIVSEDLGLCSNSVTASLLHDVPRLGRLSQNEII